MPEVTCAHGFERGDCDICGPPCAHNIWPSGGCSVCFPARCAHGFAPMSECPQCYPGRAIQPAMPFSLTSFQPGTPRARAVTNALQNFVGFAEFRRKREAKQKKPPMKKPKKIPRLGRKFTLDK